MKPINPLIVALDVPSLEQAKPLIEALAPWVGCFKVGLELITRVGVPQAVDTVHQMGGKVFLDGKFDDIPNTIAGASKAASALGVSLFNIHACCGPEAMTAANQVKGDSQLLAVTVLTAISDAQCQQIFGSPASQKVLEFATQAADCGLDGVVCSPQELTLLSQNPKTQKLLKVTPGVRPDWAQKQDQKRTMTPKQAMENGATHLVIGRPITQPPREIGSCVEAAKRILEEIKEASL